MSYKCNFKLKQYTRYFYVHSIHSDIGSPICLTYNT